MAFLEERLNVCIDYGSSYGERYSVDEVAVRNGNSYRTLNHPYPVFRHDIGFTGNNDDWVLSHIVDLFHRSGGRFGGFRVKNPAEYTTNDYIESPTFSDQVCTDLGGQKYQIVRWYGTQGASDATRRRIRKPVAGTVAVGIRDEYGNNVEVVEGSEGQWQVDETTGVIAFEANKSASVSGITQALQAVVTVGSGHPFIVDDTVHFSSVTGMTEINGLRGTVVATSGTTITVDIDTTLFSAYSSGGQVNTQPQDGETVVAGCEFDLPCRFIQDLDGLAFNNYGIIDTGVIVEEILNP